QLGNRESASSWREFFKDLKRRGLKGENLLLGAMDGLSELENAFTEAFPKAKVQRCVVHKLRNIAAKLPRKIQKNCLDLSSIERTFKEFRRRTRQMDSLPNEDCCLRCIYAMSMNLNQ
ncbi:MAG TPA: hypothetical protein DD719_01210, partial [Desulfotomaculum sp.]|nr:hypothetical protein [Desulfotomaculum sp.]